MTHLTDNDKWYVDSDKELRYKARFRHTGKAKMDYLRFLTGGSLPDNILKLVKRVEWGEGKVKLFVEATIDVKSWRGYAGGVN